MSATILKLDDYRAKKRAVSIERLHADAYIGLSWAVLLLSISSSVLIGMALVGNRYDR